MRADLMDDEGENQAVRMFLMGYGGGNHKIESLREHLRLSGFDGCWPEWVSTASGHLTKAGAQLWLQYLLNLELAGAGTAWAQASRLALELECLLIDTRDLPIMSKWWDSAHEALEQYRAVSATLK